MNDELTFKNGMEPERYELTAPGTYHFDWDRREFFKLLGAGVLVLSVTKDAIAQQESGRGRQAFGGSLPKEIGAWLHIGENGRVRVYTGKVEVGQNIRTSLSQAVAEELHFPLDQIELVMGDTQLVPFDAGTFGSQTTPNMNLQLRKVAAAAREMLIDLAAEKWQVDRKRLSAAGGKIAMAEAEREIAYAELVKGRQLTQTIPAENSLAPAAAWTVAGTPVKKVNGRDYVTGKHRYPSDQKLPEMLYGKIVRPAAFGATLVSADTNAAEQMPGVVVVR
ncbi:MAG TPA: molybdopterin cofactor-binding domain-containing protein, partial [Candidatus Acidoferrales bacterium]|nr:molybdopterin cofactor-binding domain-containing protein [Candidatus Acidoferrales bacterium]